MQTTTDTGKKPKRVPVRAKNPKPKVDATLKRVLKATTKAVTKGKKLPLGQKIAVWMAKQPAKAFLLATNVTTMFFKYLKDNNLKESEAPNLASFTRCFFNEKKHRGLKKG